MIVMAEFVNGVVIGLIAWGIVGVFAALIEDMFNTRSGDTWQERLAVAILVVMVWPITLGQLLGFGGKDDGSGQ